MDQWCHLSDIQWDNEPAAAPAPQNNIVWDDNDQAQKARDLVHGGQNSYFPNMASAAGKELLQIARHGLNLLNINGVGDTHDPSSFGTDENIKAAEEANKDAFAKPGGKFGQIVADTAGTSVIGGPVEAAVGKMVPSAFPMLSRILKSAASGGTNAALAADPGSRLEAAGEGTALGGTLGAMQGTGGRVLDGVVKKSNPLQLLESDVARSNALPGASQRNLFVPVSQGADPNDAVSSTIGNLYRSGLPYIPGVSSQLSRQSNQGLDTVMGTMLQNASPEGHVVPGAAVKDMQLSTQQVRDAYNEIYQNLRKVDNISIPKDFKTDLSAQIQAADPQIPISDVDAHVDRVFDDLSHQAQNSKNGKINAFNLKNTRDNIPTLADRVGQEIPAEQKEGLFDTTKEFLDGMFSKKYQQLFNLNSQQGKDILAAYKVNAPNYENFAPLEAAVNTPGALSTSGSFRPGAVAGKANAFTDMQGMDQSFKSVFGKSAVQPTAAARVAGYPIVTGASAYLGHLPGVAAVLGGGNLLATKTAQKALYGDTILQKTMQALIAKHPEMAEALGYAGRSALTTQVGEGDGGSP